jgi:hypothetical protein
MPDVSRLRELLAEGVPLPWEASPQDSTDDGYNATIFGNVPEDEQDVADMMIREQDAALIVAAVNALPKLLDVVDAAKGLWQVHLADCDVRPCNCGVAALRSALASLEDPS